MLKLIYRFLLGPAANAGRQVLDREARLAMPPRLLETSALCGAGQAGEKNIIPTVPVGIKLIADLRADRPLQVRVLGPLGKENRPRHP